MNFKRHKGSIVAGASGLVFASAIIIFTNEPQLKTDVYKVSMAELRELQSQLTAVDNETNVSIEQNGNVPTNNTPVFIDEVNQSEVNQSIAPQHSSEITTSEADEGNTFLPKQRGRIGEEEIATAFHEINPMNSHLLTTVCKSDSCQVEVAHTDKVAKLQFLSSVSSNDLIFAYEGYFKNIENEDGSSKSVFYFSRDPQQSM
ncbi:MAG: hypothetical protein GXP19_08220 [Gammaproteobacteria bacterium]|nr:hypothetical protein [Gammaproteobacteria bacterium]